MNVSEESIKESALTLLADGYSPIPLYNREKFPVFNKWESLTHKQLENLWARGGATGVFLKHEKNLVCLDFDGENWFDAFSKVVADVYSLFDSQIETTQSDKAHVWFISAEDLTEELKKGWFWKGDNWHIEFRSQWSSINSGTVMAPSFGPNGIYEKYNDNKIIKFDGIDLLIKVLDKIGTREKYEEIKFEKVFTDPFIRPCTHYSIKKGFPHSVGPGGHLFRLSACTEMVFAGWDDDKITQAFAGSSDFDERITRRQIASVRRRVNAGTVRPIRCDKIAFWGLFDCERCKEIRGEMRDI